MPADSCSSSPSPSPSRRFLRKGLFALIPGLLLLLAAEGAVRAYGAATRTPYFAERSVDGSTVVTFQGGLVTYDFTARKAPGTFRIFCLGASTIQGYHLVNISTIPLRLERMLNDVAPPDTRFEVINLGVMGATSQEVLEIFRDSLAYESDLYVLYLGHNELGIGLAPNLLRNTSFGPASEWLLDHGAGFELAMKAALAMMAGQAMSRPGVTLEVGDDSGIFFSERARALGAARFRRNLAAMGEEASERHRELWFVTVIGNEADHPPAKSAFFLTADETTRQKIRPDTLLAEKRVVEGRAGESRRLLAEVLAREPDYAMARFLLGRVELAEDRPDLARGEFIRARDLDDFPLRATTEINETIRRTGREKGVPVLDLERELTEQGVSFDHRLFYDHVHLTLQGQDLVAQSIYRQVLQLDRFQSWNQKGPAPSEETINAELAIPASALYHLRMTHSFFVGFLSDRPFYLRQALDFLDEAEKDAADPKLVKLVRGLIRLRSGSEEKAIAEWRSLLTGDPGAFQAAADQFFPENIVWLGDYILVDTRSNLTRVYDFQTSLSKKPVPRSLLEISSDRNFLARFDFAFKWDDGQGALIDYAPRLKTILDAREKWLDSAPEKLRKTVEFSAPLSRADVNLRGLSRIEGSDSWRTRDQDPGLTLPPVQINALLVRSIDIEMKVEGGQGAGRVVAELYWAGGGRHEFSEENKIAFPVQVGSEKTYRLPAGSLLNWLQAGTVTGLRLDPADAAGLTVTVKSIRITYY